MLSKVGLNVPGWTVFGVKCPETRRTRVYRNRQWSRYDLLWAGTQLLGTASLNDQSYDRFVMTERNHNSCQPFHDPWHVAPLLWSYKTKKLHGSLAMASITGYNYLSYTNLSTKMLAFSCKRLLNYVLHKNCPHENRGKLHLQKIVQYDWKYKHFILYKIIIFLKIWLQF